MPMNEDGTLKEVQVDGKKYKGKALYDILEHNVRRAFVSRDPKNGSRAAIRCGICGPRRIPRCTAATR